MNDQNDGGRQWWQWSLQRNGRSDGQVRHLCDPAQAGHFYSDIYNVAALMQSKFQLQIDPTRVVRIHK
jgi:hypothetical protein